MHNDNILKELTKIDSLLRSKDFAFAVAGALNGAHSGATETFIDPSDESTIITKTFRQLKLAKNLSGFYAVECGIGLLWEQTQIAPIDWLESIGHNTAGPEAMLLLTRFANATWKAGQPFISIDNITQYSFTGAGLLSGEEIEHHLGQISSAANVLLEHMKPVDKGDIDKQMQYMRTLLQDIAFAETMATASQSYPYTQHHQTPPVFLSVDDEADGVHQTVKDEKIAINLAGFYALECGVNYLVTTTGRAPSEILKSLQDETVSDPDKTIFLRFANATWKAGQPFRDLQRITREVFVPVYFLSEEEIEKDMAQIRTAAKKLLEELLQAG